MKVHTAWNADHDICVLRMSMPGATMKQFPTDAFNDVLYVARDQAHLEPYLYNIWKDFETLWGWMITESMELSDEQAFALAQEIIDKSDTNPQLAPFNPKEFDF